MKLQVQSLKYGNVGKMSATFNNAPVTVQLLIILSNQGRVFIGVSVALVSVVIYYIIMFCKCA